MTKTEMLKAAIAQCEAAQAKLTADQRWNAMTRITAAASDAGLGRNNAADFATFAVRNGEISRDPVTAEQFGAFITAQRQLFA